MKGYLILLMIIVGINVFFMLFSVEKYVKSTLTGSLDIISLMFIFFFFMMMAIVFAFIFSRTARYY